LSRSNERHALLSRNGNTCLQTHTKRGEKQHVLPQGLGKKEWPHQGLYKQEQTKHRKGRKKNIRGIKNRGQDQLTTLTTDEGRFGGLAHRRTFRREGKKGSSSESNKKQGNRRTKGQQLTPRYKNQAALVEIKRRAEYTGGDRLVKRNASGGFGPFCGGVTGGGRQRTKAKKFLQAEFPL